MSELPDDFNYDMYKLLNEDLINYDNHFLREHYIKFGKKECRSYKLPNDFNVKNYKLLNSDLYNLSDYECMIHYVFYGIKEKRKYKKKDIMIIVARYNEDISNFAEFKDNLIVYNKGKDDISKCIDSGCIIKLPNLGREAGTYIHYILENYDHLPNYMIFTQGNPCDHVYINDPIKTFNKFRELVNEEKGYKFKYISIHKEKFDIETVAHMERGVYLTPIELGEPKKIEELINDIKKYVKEKCIQEEIRSNELIDKLYNYGSSNIWPWEFNKLFMKTDWYLTSWYAHTMRHEITRDCFDYSKIKHLIDRSNGFSFGYGAIFIVHKDQILKYSKSYWERIYSTLQELLPTSGWGMESLWEFLLGEH